MSHERKLRKELMIRLGFLFLKMGFKRMKQTFCWMRGKVGKVMLYFAPCR